MGRDVLNAGPMVAALVMSAALALAQQPEELPAGVLDGGVMSAANQGATIISGDWVYRSLNESGYFMRSVPGYRSYDDIRLEPGRSGLLLEYRVRVFGSNEQGSDAGRPYNVRTQLYSGLFPFPGIAGTECLFEGLEAGKTFTLNCKATPGAAIPDFVWFGIEFNTDNAGWLMSGGFSTIGQSEHRVEVFDLNQGVWVLPDCGGGCPPICCSFTAQITVQGGSGACCDLTTFDCANIQESRCDPATSAFTQDGLCCNLPGPCAPTGACCDVAAGTCRDTICSLCDGFLEQFTEGDICADIDCEISDNLPTLSQWGDFVLVLLLLCGITIKFSRRSRRTPRRLLNS